MARADKVLEGRNGRLFLDGDSNRVVDQVTGRRQLSGRDLRRWTALLGERRAWLAEHGIAYLFVVPPNAHAVHPEDLPSGVVPTPDPPIAQLATALRADGQPPPLYLRDALRAAATTGMAYPLTDTHWSDYGAFAAYLELCTALAAQVELPVVLGEKDVGFETHPFTGDLGEKLVPPRTGETVRGAVLEPASARVHDNQVDNRGRIRIHERPDGIGPRVVLFGDSFSWRLLTWLPESCSRLLFAHTPTVDRSIVEEERPDVVISLLNERFLMEVPDDGSAGVLEVARLKRAAGRIRGRR